MSLKAILFDLDGTLLPMDQDLFMNYYFGELAKNNNQILLEEGGQVCRTISPTLLQELGSLETLKGRNKVYALSDGTVEYEIKHNTPLPLKVNKAKQAVANIYVGDKVEENYPKESFLFIRTDQSASFELSVNGHKVDKEKPEYVKLYDQDRELKEEEYVYAFILPEQVLLHKDNKFEFTTQEEKGFTVKRLELALKYGDVKTHGYF